eukprot:TRINITY_DN13263_c0_g1_i16.p1 TRINITY_DN13263_c0_g1~~TRINITY_DN13263_c0_g1_i16.p1  ORF type:complete len:111 (+),score=20.61 TRINITY_DN13263_c0_g1_i16:140-472(+)
MQLFDVILTLQSCIYSFYYHTTSLFGFTSLLHKIGWNLTCTACPHGNVSLGYYLVVMPMIPNVNHLEHSYSNSYPNTYSNSNTTPTHPNSKSKLPIPLPSPPYTNPHPNT